jgi:hypothetical protein
MEVLLDVFGKSFGSEFKNFIILVTVVDKKKSPKKNSRRDVKVEKNKNSLAC